MSLIVCVHLCSIVPLSGDETNLQEFSQFRKDLKTLKSNLGDNCNELHHNVSEMEKKLESLQMQVHSYQQKTEESIQGVVSNVEFAFQKALEVQKKMRSC